MRATISPARGHGVTGQPDADRFGYGACVGLLDRFGGSPRDRFARQVMAAARAQGVAEVRYDAARFAVVFRVHPGGDNGTIYLANVFRECEGADAEERRGRIASLVSSLVSPE